MAEQNNVTEAQRLLAEMDRKYGKSAPVAEQPVQAPVQPQEQTPKQEPGGLLKWGADLLRNRGKQIDKAAGYACGGKIKSYAAGGDVFAGYVDEDEARKSYGDEAANQVYGHTADGKPLVNGLPDRRGQLGFERYARGGKIKAHADGGKVKTIKGPGTSTSDSIPAKVKETGEKILVSNGERILSKKQDKLLSRIAQMLGYESTDALLESGTGRPVGPTMKGGKRAAGLGANGEWIPDQEDDAAPAGGKWATPVSKPAAAPTGMDVYGPAFGAVKDAPASMFPNTARTFNESGKDVRAAMDAGNYGNALGLATRGMLATGVGLADDVIGNPLRAAMPAVKDTISGVAGTVSPAAATAANPAPTPATTPATTPAANPKPGDSLLRGRDASGVITNDSVKSMYAKDGGLSGMKSGQYYSEMDLAGQNERMAKSLGYSGVADMNRPRQSESPPPPDRPPEKTQDQLNNEEKSRRWRQDDLIGQLGRGHDAAIMAAINANAHTESAAMGNAAQTRSAELQNQAALYGHGVTAQRAAGHDATLLGLEKIRTAGSPLDNRIKGAQAADAEQVSAMRGKFLDPKTPEDEKAKIKEYLSMINKKGGDGRQTAHVVGVYDSMGNKTGERLAVAPSGAEPSFYDPSAQRGQDKPVPPGYTVAGTSGGKRVLQDAKGNRFLEG